MSTQRPMKPSYTDTSHKLTYFLTCVPAASPCSWDLFSVALCGPHLFSALADLCAVYLPAGNTGLLWWWFSQGSLYKPPLVGMQKSPGRPPLFENVCLPHLCRDLAMIWYNFLRWFFSLTPIESLMNIEYLVLNGVWWQFLKLWVASLKQLCPTELSVMPELFCICAAQYGGHSHMWLLNS